jgi:hypothetical protein
MKRLLLLLCLALVAVAKENGTETVHDNNNQDAEGLASAVIAAAKADWKGNPTKEAVVSEIITNAPPAELANGHGDISAEGPCESDIEAFCLRTPPGEGRWAECLSTHMVNEDNGNVTGRKVSKRCRKAISAFYADRSRSINKNLQLATACKRDAEKFCKDIKREDGAVTACLRSHRKKLAPACQVQIFKTMLAGAYDLRTDVQLNAACASDADRLCSDTPKGKGRIQECLVCCLRSLCAVAGCFSSINVHIASAFKHPCDLHRAKSRSILHRVGAENAVTSVVPFTDWVYVGAARQAC